MLSRRAKAFFYLLAGPLMKLNGWLYYWLIAPRKKEIKVHLGPGKRSYLSGWLNLDANKFTGRCDLWVDFRNKLPFRENSVKAIYSHHVVEHLPDLQAHFADIFRCLTPGGVYRVGGPNGDSAIKKYLAGDHDWFSNFPENRASLGGRLDNFIFCRNEHLAILTHSYLEELLTAAGFENLQTCVPTQTTHFPELFSVCLPTEFETDFDTPHTILIEVQKPV